MPEPVLQVQGVTKSYGPVHALQDVSAGFAPGEIHAVLGENGAGKTTLMNVIAGFVVADRGRVVYRGEYLSPGRPQEVKARGIRMVHQHFMLVPAFTVAENLALGAIESQSGLLDLGETERSANTIARELGWDLPLRERTGRLPVGVQQRAEIVGALMGEAAALILDEPTAVLSPDEVEDLFRVLRRLRDAGRCVVLIAHKLSEVLAIADRVTVLRSGAVVATHPTTEVDEHTLASWMVGEIPAPRSPLSPTSSEQRVSVRDLWVEGARGEDAVRGVSFDLRPGEILGVGGVDGNGQNELAEAVAGVRPPSKGEVRYSSDALNTGYIPQDRRAQGLALQMTVRDNLLIAGQHRKELWRGPFLSVRELQVYARDIVEGFDVKVSSTSDQVVTLSGGNQQKIVVGRVLKESPDVIVACNPTRGLDVKATAYVQQRILDAARNGAAVLLFSADLDELAALATRTLYMSRGRLAEGGATALAGGGA